MVNLLRGIFTFIDDTYNNVDMASVVLGDESEECDSSLTPATPISSLREVMCHVFEV